MPQCPRRLSPATQSLLRLIFLTAALAALPAAAQTRSARDTTPPASPTRDLRHDDYPVFTAQSLDDAIERSRREYRPLLLYFRNHGKAFDNADDVLWSSPTVRAWVEWHAIAVRIDLREDPTLFAKTAAKLPFTHVINAQADPLRWPMVFVFRGSRFARVVPDTKMQADMFKSFLGIGDRPNPEVFYLKPPRLLLQLDIWMDKMRAADPGWFLLHDHLNPEPPEPEPHRFADADDGLGAPILDDQPPADRAQLLALFLKRVRDARSAVADGSAYEATGLYTWIWETAIDDPELRPFARTIIAAEMRDLGQHREASRERFIKLRDDLAAREFWHDFDDSLTNVILNEITGTEPNAILALMKPLRNEWEEGFMTIAEIAAWELIGGRDRWVDPAARRPDSLARLQRLCSSLNDRAPTTSDGDDWPDLLAFRRSVWVDESCRLAALFDAGTPESDAVIAPVLRAGGHAARAIIITLAAQDRLDPPRLARLLATPAPTAAPDPANTTPTPDSLDQAFRLLARPATDPTSSYK